MTVGSDWCSALLTWLTELSVVVRCICSLWFTVGQSLSVLESPKKLVCLSHAFSNVLGRVKNAVSTQSCKIACLSSLSPVCISGTMTDLMVYMAPAQYPVKINNTLQRFSFNSNSKEFYFKRYFTLFFWFNAAMLFYAYLHKFLNLFLNMRKLFLKITDWLVGKLIH